MNRGQFIGGTLLVGAIVGLGGVIFGLNKKKEADKAVTKAKEVMDNAAEILADNTSVDVSDEIIQMAAEKAAMKASEKAIAIVRKDINVKVYNAVSTAYANVEEDVNTRLTKAIERDIDMDHIRTSVENKAASMIFDKFMHELTNYSSPIMTHIMTTMNRRGSAV